MNPVDCGVGEEEEEGDREDSVGDSPFLDPIVIGSVLPHLRDEPRDGHQSDPGERDARRLDLHRDLSLEESRVVHHLVVEDEVVGQSGDGKVHEDDSDEGDDVEGGELTRNVVSRPCRGDGGGEGCREIYWRMGDVFVEG